MTTYATPDDVEVRLGRPLTDPAQAVALLRDAEVLIRSRVLDLAARVADEPGFLDVVVMVEANAVVRVLRNPEGLRAVTVTVDDGSVTRTRDQATSDGALRITDDEWDLLAPVGLGEAASIRLRYEPGWLACQGERAWRSGQW
ncbi:Gp19/Gp15/Gp42 family protein [Cellulomonas gilvus]|uniref:Phage protein Gp19/Gp15/Gp42 n=1 Tax=Cellulomonas gilvus (strain ATCC 13127 / NRRL B-14078) TaxID=593907 RepID=F8A2G3_CELGA|nr:Gp19/Gp15/Gp42 family protein [Cellulomonas gilvus]AEI11820.1 Phage protein Gp19/Gp15/Gp42 [Cellulomonas gilvus ATCC 13127]